MANKKTAEPQRENLRDIINAVAEKEDVITAFRGDKKPLRTLHTEEPAYGLAYLLWNFLGGLCFGLGLLLMVLLTAWLLLHFNEVRAIAGLFGKFTALLKSLGR